MFSVFTGFGAWQMVWNDEFDYNGLPDSTKWGYDVGTGSNGWGNSELEYYTKDSLKNAHAEDGKLFITAVKEKIKTSNYSSVRLVSREKGDWLYGRFEVAATVPKGIGLWPAIWMLPTDWEYGNWPSSGEIDMMENVGFDSMNVHFNIHTEAYNHSIGTNKGATVKLDDPHTTFNVYALEWYTDSLLFFVNGKQVFMFKNEHTGYKTWPYDKRFHLLLNVAVGGSWGGQQGVNDAAFPASMVIDYVRVYKQVDPSAALPQGRVHDEKPFFAIHGTSALFSAKGNGTLSLYALGGKRIFSKAVPSGRTSCALPSYLPQGVYRLCFETPGQTVSQSLTVCR